MAHSKSSRKAEREAGFLFRASVIKVYKSDKTEKNGSINLYKIISFVMFFTN